MYDKELSKTMVRISELTYRQYYKGPPSTNDGHVDVPNGFTQVASFTAPEVDISSKHSELKKISWKDVTDPSELDHLSVGIDPVYFGFALTSKDMNVIALRGTKSAFEWITDLDIDQVPLPMVWYSQGHFEEARVHMGFLFFQVMLAKQILEAVKKFDPSLPCYITGHSLGAALSTLTAPMVKLLSNKYDVRVYNYASPRVGNQAFANIYNFRIPLSYRVVNLSDVVPIVPPSSFPAWSWKYQHIGQEWSFINQSGNVPSNHALIGPGNYTDAVENEIPTNSKRTYPVSGLGNT